MLGIFCLSAEQHELFIVFLNTFWGFSAGQLASMPRVLGLWSQALGLWSLVLGLRSHASGLWSLAQVSGLGPQVFGLWL